MNHFSPGNKITIPSTLNLYALAGLSMVTSKKDMPKSPVTLPQNIPYMTPSVSAIPEMRSPTVVLSVLIVIVVLMIRRSRKFVIYPATH